MLVIDIHQKFLEYHRKIFRNPLPRNSSPFGIGSQFYFCIFICFLTFLR